MLERRVKMEEKIEGMISYLFGKYDMRQGDKNYKRMEKLLKFCMEDMEKYPCLFTELDSKEKLEFFVIQSMIRML